MDKRYSFFISVVIFVLFIVMLFFWNKNVSRDQISVVIVPHHDLVKEKRAEVLREVGSKTHPQTIILASPNHFFAGSGDIITTDKTWRLLDGEILPDKEKVARLTEDNLISNEETAFSREHGITNMLADINGNFPGVKIIPLILRENTSKENIAKLAGRLEQVCPRNCLLVASVDFSHYLPGALAEMHDALSIRALNNLDEELLWQAEVDSNQSLTLAIKWAKFNKTEKFVLKENTNSGKISEERDAETTSYVLGYFAKGNPQLPKTDTTFMISHDLAKNPAVIGERFFRGADKEFNGDWIDNELFSPFKSKNSQLFAALDKAIAAGDLVAAGDIDGDNLKLVLLPIKNISSAPELLRGEEKTAVIKHIRAGAGLEISNYDYGYDIIKLNN